MLEKERNRAGFESANVMAAVRDCEFLPQEIDSFGHSRKVLLLIVRNSHDQQPNHNIQVFRS